MASSKTNRAAVTQQVAEAPKGLVCCMDCIHGLLHRYGNDPVLAACLKQPQPMNERFPYVVEVARFLRHCSSHEIQLTDKVIEQRRKTA